MPADLTPEAFARAQEVIRGCAHGDPCDVCLARALLEWGAERDAVIAEKDAAARGLRNSISGPLSIEEWETRRAWGNTNVAVVWEWIKRVDDALALTPAAVSEHVRRERRVVDVALRWAGGLGSGDRRAAKIDMVTGELLAAIDDLAALDAPPAGGA